MRVIDVTRVKPLFEEDQSTISKLAVDTTLAPLGKSITIGSEKENKITDNISVYISNQGSYRFVYKYDGKIISGLQIMSKDGKRGVISNVYTLSKFRRKGIAGVLLKAAREIFNQVDHSESVTDLGKKFKIGTG